jgi:hypothetical protein
MKRASVLECGGWRGTGLTPLSVGRRRSRLEVGCSLFDVSLLPKAACALTPGPLLHPMEEREKSRSLMQYWEGRVRGAFSALDRRLFRMGVAVFTETRNNRGTDEIFC